MISLKRKANHMGTHHITGLSSTLSNLISKQTKSRLLFTSPAWEVRQGIEPTINSIANSMCETILHQLYLAPQHNLRPPK